MDAAAARNYPPGDIRVSDADRDRAITELGQHFQAGRITADELEERTGLALKAKTGNDLTVLLADLPVSQAPVMTTPVVTAPPGSRGPLPRRHTPGAAIAIVVSAWLVVFAVVGFLSAGSGSGYSQHGYLAGLLPVLIVVLILRSLAGGRRRM